MRQAGLFQLAEAIDARPAAAGLECVAGVKGVAIAAWRSWFNGSQLSPLRRERAGGEGIAKKAWLFSAMALTLPAGEGTRWPNPLRLGEGTYLCLASTPAPARSRSSSPCLRMSKTEASGVQGNGPQPHVVILRAKATADPYWASPKSGMSAAGGLHANLVRAAGLQGNFQPGAPGGCRPHAIVQHGPPPAGMVRPDHFRPRPPGILYTKSSQVPVSGAI